MEARSIYTPDNQLENPRVVYSPRPASTGSGSGLDDGSAEMEAYVAEQEDEAETLRRISGRTDLANLASLTMTVDTAEVTISRIGEHLPNLRELKLNHSYIETVRHLGTGLSNLQILWVSRCGLQRLDGLGSVAPRLRELYASFNSIAALDALQGCDALEVLDLEGNCVESIEEVGLLGLCPRLEAASLEGNPVALAFGTRFRAAVAAAVPQLQLIDDEPVTDEERRSVGAAGPAEGQPSGLTEGREEQESTGGDEMALLQLEAALVGSAARSARVGFDSHEFDEVEAAVADGVEVRPGTAGLRRSLANLRPSTTGSKGGGGRAGASRGSARPSSAFRPASAAATGAGYLRPRSAAPGRPGSGGSGRSSLSPSASFNGGLFWKKHRLGASSSQTGEDGAGAGADTGDGGDEGGSGLTMGGAEMGGGAAAALRRRRGPGKPQNGGVSKSVQLTSSRSLGNSIGEARLSTDQILEELRAWKISATEAVLKEEEGVSRMIPETLFSSDDEDDTVDGEGAVVEGVDLLTLGESSDEGEAEEEDNHEKQVEKGPPQGLALPLHRLAGASEPEDDAHESPQQDGCDGGSDQSNSEDESSPRSETAPKTPRTMAHRSIRGMSRHRLAVEQAQDFMWQLESTPPMLSPADSPKAPPFPPALPDHDEAITASPLSTHRQPQQQAAGTRLGTPPRPPAHNAAFSSSSKSSAAHPSASDSVPHRRSSGSEDDSPEASSKVPTPPGSARASNHGSTPSPRGHRNMQSTAIAAGDCNRQP